MSAFSRRQALLGFAGLAIAATTAACSSSTATDTPAAGASASGEVTYWLWDSNQLPVYQKVADAFTAANP